MKNFLNQVIAFILIISLSGCIGSRAYKTPKVEANDLKISSAKKTKIFVKWKVSSAVEHNRILVSKAHEKILKDYIIGMECCSIVQEENEADVVIDGGWYNDSGEPCNICATISGASMLIIPSWGTSEMRVSATVTKNKKTYTYDADDSLFFAFWLPFIVAMPFTGNPVKMEGNMSQDLYKNLLLKMKNDGIFVAKAG